VACQTAHVDWHHPQPVAQVLKLDVFLRALLLRQVKQLYSESRAPLGEALHEEVEASVAAAYPEPLEPPEQQLEQEQPEQPEQEQPPQEQPPQEQPPQEQPPQEQPQ
jgi:hypothetical protein